MDQLNDLAVNGDLHHYKIDTGLFLLDFHAGASMTSDHRARLKGMRENIGQKPDKKKSALIARGALALLNELRRVIPGPNYSAIYGHIYEGLTDTE